MSKFLTLFKYEFKKQFPTRLKKDRTDIVGFILSLSVTLLIVGMFIYFLSVIATNYVEVKIDKVLDSESRAYELLNLLYSVILVFLVVMCLENMRKTLTDKTDKKILLRLPVNHQTLFLSKLSVLLLKNYIITFLVVVPTNIIIYLALAPSAIFWLSTFIVWLVFPIIVMLFSSILIIPYLKLINFIKNKYILVFICLSVLLAAFVLIYTSFLGVVQAYLETGYIKFIFNENFIKTLQVLLRWLYPANCLAGIVIGKDLLKSILVVVAFIVASGLFVYFVTQKLYCHTLYKSEDTKTGYKGSTKFRKLTVMTTLVKKEFIAVSREPKHIFSYLVIATIMPILVYCCYTLFESLIVNMIGIKITFGLALFILVIFSVLTNTFCSTNITREGVTILKQKTFPIKAQQLLLAKVIFCSMISFASVLISVVALVAVTSVTFVEGIACLVVGGAFTLAQILFATKLDLKNIRTSFTSQQLEKRSSLTIIKVVALGLIVSLVAGVAALLLNLLALSKFAISVALVYIVPIVLALVYLGLAIWYYFHNLQYSLDNVAK